MAFSDYGESLTIDPLNNIVYIKLEKSILGIDGTSGIVIKNLSRQGDSTQGVILLNPTSNKMFISDSENMTIINLTNNKILANLTLPNDAYEMGIDEENNLLYMVDDETLQNLAVLNATAKSTKVFELPLSAYNVAINPKLNKVYLLDTEANDLSSFDPVQERIVANISIMEGAEDIAVNPITNYIYLSRNDGGRLQIINGTNNQIQHNIITGTYSEEWEGSSLDVNPISNTIYFGDVSKKQVIVINGTSNEVINRIPVGIAPVYISINSNTGELFVFDEDSERLAKISKNNKVIPIFGYQAIENKDNTAINAIRTSKFASGMDIDPETHTIYVIDSKTNIIYAFNSISHIAKGTIELPNIATQIKTLPGINRIAIAYEDEPGLFLLNPQSNKTGSRYEMPPVGSMAVDIQKDSIYATSRDPENHSTDNNASLYAFHEQDLTNFYQRNTSLQSIYAISVDPVSGKVYLAGNLFEILDIPSDTTKVLDEKVLASPRSIAVNSKENLVYVLGNKPSTNDSIDYSDKPNTLYFIDGIRDTIKHVSFNADLNDVKINENTGTLYVSGSTVSSDREIGIIFIVNGSTNSVIENIPLGLNPTSILINPTSNVIYVLDPTMGSIFTIDGITNAVIPARSSIDFETFPYNSGDIFCNNNKVSNFVLEYGYNTKIDCRAKAYPKFKFDSWGGNVKGTSANMSFRVTNDATIAANFSELPSPLTPTDITGLIGLVALIPTAFFIINYIKKRKKRKRNDQLHD